MVTKPRLKFGNRSCQMVYENKQYERSSRLVRDICLFSFASIMPKIFAKKKKTNTKQTNKKTNKQKNLQKTGRSLPDCVIAWGWVGAALCFSCFRLTSFLYPNQMIMAGILLYPAIPRPSALRFRSLTWIAFTNFLETLHRHCY